MTQTTVITKTDKTYGGYNYIEYSAETQQFTIGNSRAHMGHSRYNVKIEAVGKKAIKELEKHFRSLGYQEIETFRG